MKLELFKYDGCPYCQRVMGEIRKSGRTDVEYHDIQKNPADYKRLLTEGGIDQAPCLFIDGKPLYESADIIAWLAAHPQE